MVNCDTIIQIKEKNSFIKKLFRNKKVLTLYLKYITKIN
jgi:hypothetical protein